MHNKEQGVFWGNSSPLQRRGTPCPAELNYFYFSIAMRSKISVASAADGTLSTFSPAKS